VGSTLEYRETFGSLVRTLGSSTRLRKALRANWLKLTGPAPGSSKQWRAAQFFLQHFKDMSEAELDRLIADIWRDRRLEEIRLVTGLDPTNPTLTVLDVGGGLTSVARLFTTPRKCVLDICASELRTGGARFKRGLSYITGSAHQIPFSNDEFDFVFCSNALDHFENPSRAVREMKRVTKPGGYVIVVCDVFDADSRRKPGTLHPHCFTRSEAERLLESGMRLVWSYCPPEAGKLGFSSRAQGVSIPKPGRREMSFVLSKDRVG
jgi:demethylmenaquinone methyltransferase/2-methoxy-6-polyprenyl-1,4-benzoquinol methylase